jgi:DNA-binding protein YbaB
MFGALQQAQQKMQELKQQLDFIYIKEDAAGSGLFIEMSASKKVRSIEIPDQLMEDKEQLEELLITTFNKVSESADKIAERHMQSAAQDILPGMGQLFGGLK